MIELPDAIVIYPQKKTVPDYLLCWIPGKEYAAVIKRAEVRRDLSRYHPNGIEVELSPEALAEAAVDLGTPPDRLRKAYHGLLEASLIPESGMVKLTSLLEFLGEEQTRSRDEIFAELFEQKARLSELREDELFHKIASPPPMTSGAAPKKVYRRLNIQQAPPSDEEKEV